MKWHNYVYNETRLVHLFGQRWYWHGFKTNNRLQHVWKQKSILDHWNQSKDLVYIHYLHARSLTSSTIISMAAVLSQTATEMLFSRGSHAKSLLWHSSGTIRWFVLSEMVLARFQKQLQITARQNIEIQLGPLQPEKGADLDHLYAPANDENFQHYF